MFILQHYEVHSGHVPEEISRKWSLNAAQPVVRMKHVRQIIPIALETELANYLKTFSLMSHGLTQREARCLAFKFAIAKNLTVPTNWIEKGEASEDWFSYFLKRNPSL